MELDRDNASSWNFPEHWLVELYTHRENRKYERLIGNILIDWLGIESLKPSRKVGVSRHAYFGLRHVCSHTVWQGLQSRPSMAVARSYVWRERRDVCVLCGCCISVSVSSSSGPSTSILFDSSLSLS